jgi:hypothetical protein
LLVKFRIQIVILWLNKKDFLLIKKGQKATIAYKENQNDAFNYIVMSYDARGRVEAIMKWNENTGFDMVHYTYNSMNQVLTVTSADAQFKFMIWNEYDDNNAESMLVWNPSKVNPVIPDAKLILRPLR